MNRNQAESEIFSRLRDFYHWLPTEILRRAHPRPRAGIEPAAEYLRQTLPIVGPSDPGAWRPGGWKRADLDEAFAVLELAPLDWNG